MQISFFLAYYIIQQKTKTDHTSRYICNIQLGNDEEIRNKLLKRMTVKSRLQFSRLGLFPFKFSQLSLRPKASCSFEYHRVLVVLHRSQLCLVPITPFSWKPEISYCSCLNCFPGKLVIILSCWISTARLLFNTASKPHLFLPPCSSRCQLSFTFSLSQIVQIIILLNT